MIGDYSYVKIKIGNKIEDRWIKLTEEQKERIKDIESKTVKIYSMGSRINHD